MKKTDKLKAALSALLTAAALTSCGMTGDIEINGSERDDKSGTVTSVTAEPVAADVRNELSGECRGYGQGTETDEKGRPLGATGFNNMYKQLDAYALREDTDKILLTFDQGYENGFTADILDTLKEKKVKAVFFILQDYAERNPELVQRMIDEGHIVANHSVHHYSMPTLSEEDCRREILDMHEYMQQNFGVEMDLFRPPMGEYSEKTLAVTKDCGYKTVMWSFAYADWDTENQPDPNAALKKMVDAAHPGAVYLLHSVSSTNAAVLGNMIDNIRDKGFEFEKLKNS